MQLHDQTRNIQYGKCGYIISGYGTGAATTPTLLQIWYRQILA